MKRSLASEIKTGSKVLLKGFVEEIRNLGSIKFIILRDASGTIQVTATKKKTPNKIFEQITKIPRESVIAVEGPARTSKQAPGGKEIILEKLNVISKAAQPLPIDISDFSKTELPKRLDWRSLDLRNTKVKAIFKIQSEIINSFRNFFKEKGFIEIQTPCIISTSSEGGTDLFPVMYFEKPAYLAQSPQLYKQMSVISLEKVFLTIPVWRAEKHNTVRHINEARQLDIEMAFADDFIVMDIFAEVIQTIIKNIKQKCKEELKLFKTELKVPKIKYISYKKIVELLKKNKIKINLGGDIPPDGEKKISELFKETIVFIHDWPIDLKPFYIMPKDDKISKGFDAIYNGIEISSGGQRIHIPELLIKQIKSKGLNPKNFEHYINSFRYGAMEHAGWSIGLERFTMALLNLSNIREATLFPRDRERLVP